MIVKITGKHIREGLPRCAFLCPIALAMRDAGCTWTTVGSNTVTARRGATLYYYALDDTGKRFVKDFDSGECVEIEEQDDERVLVTLTLRLCSPDER